MVQPRADAGWPITEDELQDINEVVARYANPPDIAKLTLEQDRNECITEVMRLMMAQNAKKPLVPVTSTTIQQALKANLNQKSAGIAKPVIAHAQRRFAAMGFEMAEIKTGASGNTSNYILRSVLPGSFLAEVLNSDQENAMAGLKLQVQLFFYVKGDNSTEEDLRKHLARFGLHLEPLKEQNKAQDEDVYEKFGTSSPIQTLLDQKFLALTKQQGPDGDVEVLTLGDAAKGDCAEMTHSETEQELKDLTNDENGANAA